MAERRPGQGPPAGQGSRADRRGSLCRGRAELGVDEEQSRAFVLPVPAGAPSGRAARFAAVPVLVTRLSDGDVWSMLVAREP
jgi:hypothetical protein